jgi:hypothetical protein
MLYRSLLNLGLLLFGLASAASGLTLQIKYHMHHQARVAAAGWDYPSWSLLHKVTSAGLLALVAIHLWVNWKWLRGTWSKGLLQKHRQLVTMSLVFLTAALMGMGAWALDALGVGPQAERIVVEIHDKVTLFLVVYLMLHVWSRRRRLVR